MIGIIKFLQKRPSDNTILFGRIAFGVLYTAIMWYNLIYLNKDIDSVYFFGFLELSIEQVLITKYIFTGLGIIPIFMGVTNICLLKKKYLKMLQIFFAIVLFYIAGSIKDSATLDFDIIIGLMGLLPLFAGITGKCITTKCLKYKEKITKIRV
ncbi:hypothetical protein H3C61_03955 [Candidatus Gracilibacteria bacterium]|nr:hypothetical protein [Candidatus Gracilibacteria bacterium]